MRIAIVGLGLIGGSLALKLTEAGYSVWGISRNPATCQEALERGAVQGCGTELAQLTLFNPQVVVICTPWSRCWPPWQPWRPICRPRQW
jgi:arogenate dehydrogenase (NADP+)